MNDLPLTEETDRVADLGILYQAEDVVVSRSGLLFCGEVFNEIGDGITLTLEFAGVEGNATGSLGPKCQRVVNVIFVETGRSDFLGRETAGELVDDGADHLKVGEFLCTCIRYEMSTPEI